jgi:hypothetical protein
MENQEERIRAIKDEGLSLLEKVKSDYELSVNISIASNQLFTMLRLEEIVTPDNAEKVATILNASSYALICALVKIGRIEIKETK